MNLEKLVRLSLWVTIPANLVVGMLMAVPDSSLSIMLSFPEADTSFYTLLVGAIVAMFGGAYLWLVLQPRLLKPLLLLGAAGKFVAGSLAVVLTLQQAVPLQFAMLISGDLLLALLWTYYVFSASSDDASSS